MSSFDHPEVLTIIRTGYPSWMQEKFVSCERCGELIEENESYEDDMYDVLCEDCLLKLHKKW